MLPFGVTIPAAVLQRSEIPEGLTNYPVELFVTGTDGRYWTNIGRPLADHAVTSW